MAWEAKRMDSSRPSVTSLWDNSGGESAFGKQAAKQIWQFESNEKGVGYGTGTEEIGKNHIPGKSGNAADEREPSESGN